MMTQKNILQEFDRNSSLIRAFGVKRLGLFGSFVRGQARSQSDVDILVEFNRGRKTFDGFMDLKFFLQKVFHRKVDLVLKGALKPRIRKKILGEVVYARL